MSEDIRENITRRSIWLRLAFMIVFGIAFYIAELVTFAVVALQLRTAVEK